MINEPDIKQIFNSVGGTPFFRKLVDTFYTKVEKDPLLRPIFPESLDQGKHWQFLFLQEIFGGPTDYQKLRGSPMLRRRHLPFKIDIYARDRWIKLMLESLDELGINNDHPARKIMQKYFEGTATKMINRNVTGDYFSASDTPIQY